LEGWNIIFDCEISQFDIKNRKSRKKKIIKRGDNFMKNDKYLKIILTIIAICLVWICVRDINIGSQKIYASNNNAGQEEVWVTGGEIEVSGIEDAVWGAIQLSQPIEVKVVNMPSSIQSKEK